MADDDDGVVIPVLGGDPPEAKEDIYEPTHTAAPVAAMGFWVEDMERLRAQRQEARRNYQAIRAAGVDYTNLAAYEAARDAYYAALEIHEEAMQLRHEADANNDTHDHVQRKRGRLPPHPGDPEESKKKTVAEAGPSRRPDPPDARRINFEDFETEEDGAGESRSRSPSPLWDHTTQGKGKKRRHE